MNKGQNGSSLVGKSLKFHAYATPEARLLRWFSYIILLDSGGREFRGRVLPCRPVVVDRVSAGGRPTLSWL